MLDWHAGWCWRCTGWVCFASKNWSADRRFWLKSSVINASNLSNHGTMGACNSQAVQNLFVVADSKTVSFINTLIISLGGLPLANPQVVGALTSGKAVGAAATASAGGWDSPNLLVCRNHTDWLWEWFGYPMIFWWYWAYPNLPSTFWVDPLGEW